MLERSNRMPVVGWEVGSREMLKGEMCRAALMKSRKLRTVWPNVV